jgi:shikimate dehydrogenase
VTDLVVLLGHQIGYSASPAMHNAAFSAVGLDARYELADVPASALSGAVAALRGPGYLGANVTQPHKLAVCELVDELAPEVERLGAANTIVRDGRRLVAHNTDLPGLAAELAELGPIRAAVVLGAGGASRAVQAALADAGASVEVADRARWGALPDLLAAADLLVNATPIGTGSDETPVPADLLRPDLAVLDLVYRPSPTRLVRDARAVGATARGGAGVLLRQAAASFTLWTDRAAPIEAMRDALHAELGAEADA